MHTRLLGLAALIVAVAANVGSADVVWTGAADSDIQNDSNYDFSGSGLSTISGIEGSNLLDNVVFNNSGTAPELPNTGAGQFNYGSATFGLTFDNVVSTFAAGSNEGWRGNTVSLINGAQTTSFFYVSSTVSIDANSSVFLLGGGNPVNLTTVDMAPGAMVTFTLEDVSEFNAEHLGKFTVNGNPLVAGVNATVVSDGGTGTIVTAIPEPGFLAILGIAGVGFVLRRRK
jgi:hypothetical protein